MVVLSAIAEQIQRNFLAQTMSEEELKVSVDMDRVGQRRSVPLIDFTIIASIYTYILFLIAANIDRLLSRFEGRGFGLQ